MAMFFFCCCCFFEKSFHTEHTNLKLLPSNGSRLLKMSFSSSSFSPRCWLPDQSHSAAAEGLKRQRHFSIKTRLQSWSLPHTTYNHTQPGSVQIKVPAIWCLPIHSHFSDCQRELARKDCFISVRSLEQSIRDFSCSKFSYITLSCE